MPHRFPGPILVFLLLATLPLSAQKVLQIEKYGRAKTEKFYIGDPITYQLRGEDVWHTLYIEDLLVEEGYIMFEDRFVALDSISAFRKERGWTKAASISLYTFGAAWSGCGVTQARSPSRPA